MKIRKSNGWKVRDFFSRNIWWDLFSFHHVLTCFLALLFAEAEEVVPFCSESDDYSDEAQEVLRDQGPALPYTKGFHLICQLVAAMNPDDLDQMDESIPFTKATLDNLLGVQHNEESYRHYFDHFCNAQRNRKIEGPLDQIKKNTQWNYQDFLRAPVAKDIPQVQQFKRQLQGH